MARNKYGAVRVRADGKTFDSKREYRRYCDLKNLLRGGEIESLEIHPRYDFVVNGMKVGFYTADFRYLDRRSGETVVEDVKADVTKTTSYRLRKKLMKAIHGIDITEV